MPLLFDEQLSETLVSAVADLFPGSMHVRLMGKAGASDREVWDLAREHGCVLVTRDEDFHRLSVLLGAPPKVIWLRLGNCPTRAIVDLLRKYAADISRFAAQHEATLLELG